MKMQSLKQILQKIRHTLIYLFIWTFLYPAAHYMNITPLLTTFGDSNIDFTIGIKLSNYLDTFPVRHDLIKALKKQFDLEKIEISFPCRNVYIKQATCNE